MTFEVMLNSGYNMGQGVPVEQAGAPLFLNLIANNMAAGNDTFDLIFSRNIESPGSNAKLGWTIEISPDGTTWSTMDLTSATASITDNKIQFGLSSLTRSTIEANVRFRTTYSSATGDIRNVNGGTDLASFGPDTTYANNSTVDLQSNIVDWYKLGEAAGATRAAEVSSPTNDLADVSTVGQRAGASGNAADFTGANYLFRNALFGAPSDGKFTIAFYYIQDTLPSVKAAGDAYVANRWRSNNTREWGVVIPDNTSAPQQIDTMYMVGQNSGDSVFSQHFKNRGAFTNATWYLVVCVYDPDAATPVIGYTQQLNTPGDFTTEDDNYSAPASGSPQCKQTGGGTDFNLGYAPTLTAHQGCDGGIDTVIFYNRALTQAEAQAMGEQYNDPEAGWLVDTS